MIYSKGYKYRLEEEVIIPVPFAKCIPNSIFYDNTYVSYDQGDLWIGESYAWDGPSGPMPDLKSTMFGSLIHDAWYQLIREGKMPRYTKPAADNWYGELCVEDGLWKWVADASVLLLAEYGDEAIDRGRPIKRISTR